MHGPIEMGPTSGFFEDGCGFRGQWKSHSWTGLIGVGSQEGKAIGWTWIDTENSPRSKAKGKVVTNIASGEKQMD